MSVWEITYLLVSDSDQEVIEEYAAQLLEEAKEHILEDQGEEIHLVGVRTTEKET